MEKPANGSGNAGDQLDMEDSVGDMVIGNQTEDLGLVDVPGVGAGVKDAVGIQGIGLAVPPSGFLNSPLGMNAQAGCGGKAALLIEVEGLLDAEQESMGGVGL
jgi:hypothetical protein